MSISLLECKGYPWWEETGLFLHRTVFLAPNSMSGIEEMKDIMKASLKCKPLSSREFNTGNPEEAETIVPAFWHLMLGQELVVQ